MNEEKRRWRQQMKSQRAQMSPEARALASQQIFQAIKSFIFQISKSQSEPSFWAGFRAFEDEVDLHPLYLIKEEKVLWCFPKTVNETQMEFRLPKSMETGWGKSKWGIWEPDSKLSDLVSLNQLTGIIVPALAFDRQGQRLGYGKGYYDRILKNFNGVKVGVCFEKQLQNTPLPTNDDDVPVNYVVTDKEIFSVPGRH